MKIYCNQSRYSEALNLYQKLADLLKNDFMLKPEKQTRILFEEITMLRANKGIKYGDISFIPDIEAVNKIREVINEGISFNVSKSVFIYGEAGVGKNNIIDHSINDEIKANCNIYNIKCNLNENAFSYNSIYYLLRKIDDEEINELTDTIFNMSINLIGENKFDFNAPIHDIIIDKLVKLFKGKNVVLVINEFCNMDVQSKMILNEVYKLAHIVVIITSRKEKCGGKPFCNCLCKDSSNLHIKLWNKNQTKMYLKSKGHTFDEKNFENIYRVSQGNRIFIDGIIESGLLEATSYSQIIDEGILNISRKNRKLLDLISIFNYSVKFEDLILIYPDSEIELVEQLEYLISINLLKVESNSKGNYYSFKYQILKEYLYNKIDKVKRSHYCSLIALFYEKKYANNLTIYNIYIISYYFEHSDNEIQALKYRLLYLLLISSTSLEIFPSAACEDYSKKDIEDQITVIEKKMKKIDADDKDYSEANLYFVLVKLYLRISSFKTRGVLELLSKAKKICESSQKVDMLETVYLLQLFYAQNIADTSLFRKSLDVLKQYKTYYFLNVRMEAYYLFLTGDTRRAIDMLETKIIYLKRHDIDDSRLFASYIYLSEFWITDKNYRRALSKLNRAKKILDNTLISSSGQSLLYGYLVICYYRQRQLNKAIQIVPKLLTLLESSSIAWKKSLFYSYIYLINDDKQYYKLAKKYYRKSFPSEELKQIDSNLQL